MAWSYTAVRFFRNPDNFYGIAAFVLPETSDILLLLWVDISYIKLAM